MHNPHGGGNSYELERALGQDMLHAHGEFLGDGEYDLPDELRGGGE